MGEDPEYQSFVRKTDFDYKQDLDTAMVAFAPKGKYMLLKGRFDWKSLKSYVLASDGRCNNSFCKMAGSTPEKRISFFPMQSNLMAMAVSDDDVAALRMNTVDARPDAEIPNAPIWLSIPPSVVKSGQSLPAGTQMFARSLERAQAVTLAVVPEGDRFAAKLNVRCASDADAAALAGGPDQDHRPAARADRAGTPEAEPRRPERLPDLRRLSERRLAGVGLLADHARPDRESSGRKLRSSSGLNMLLPIRTCTRRERAAAAPGSWPCSRSSWASDPAWSS